MAFFIVQPKMCSQHVEYIPGRTKKLNKNYMIKIELLVTLIIYIHVY